MRLIAGFLKLLRLPNLIFIALTQILFQYCIFYPLFENSLPPNDRLQFIFIVMASVFIAAAGYIINDYFDINIDEVNKPGDMVVDKVIHRRWAIAWHLMFSATGIIFTVLAVPLVTKWFIILANMVCVGLLWFYSTGFKRQLLIGNLVISILTAWVVVIPYFSKLPPVDFIGSDNPAHYKLFRITFLYAGFAFIISLIREAIKDLEDLPGDERYGCKTMPIVWGINAAKVYVAVWLVVLMALLVILQIYVLQFKWMWPVVYTVCLVLAPLGYILLRLFSASEPVDYRRLSRWTKFVMLTGILSMIFFRFYL